MVPADVVAGSRVEVQRIGVRIVVRRLIQSLSRQLSQPLDQRGRAVQVGDDGRQLLDRMAADRKSTRLNSSHSQISYAVFCLKKKNKPQHSVIKKLNQLLMND